jgi:hypothetical protein
MSDEGQGTRDEGQKNKEQRTKTKVQRQKMQDFVRRIYLVTFALCGGRPRTAQKIRLHGLRGEGMWDKGRLIFSFVVAFSVSLLRGRQKRKK